MHPPIPLPLPPTHPDPELTYTTHLATTTDIPSLTTLHFLSFGDELSPIIPNTPSGRAWLAEAFRVCFEEFEEECLTILIESIPTSAESVSSQNDVETAKVVAYARYIIPTRRAWENMFSYPPAGEGMDQTVLEKFLGGLERVQRCTMEVEVESVGTEGGRRYLWFENLATHPDHQRRGLGGSLVKYACAIADELGFETYLDASEEGRGLYEKFGFKKAVPKFEDGEGSAISVPMVREPVRK